MFSEFLRQLESGSVETVTFADNSTSLLYRLKGVEDGAMGKLCTTTAVAGARENLLQRLVALNVSFGQAAASKLSRLSSFLILLIPFLYIFCMAWVLQR